MVCDKCLDMFGYNYDEPALHQPLTVDLLPGQVEPWPVQPSSDHFLQSDHAAVEYLVLVVREGSDEPTGLMIITNR